MRIRLTWRRSAISGARASGSRIGGTLGLAECGGEEEQRDGNRRQEWDANSRGGQSHFRKVGIRPTPHKGARLPVALLAVIWQPAPVSQTNEVDCCIVGGGPAGMMLGYLLARAGVEVLLLEKHADFLRDFRGDTIHPSTLDLIYELGLLEAFLALPHQEITKLSGVVSGTRIGVADFSHSPTHAKFLAFMPQWDFLNFLADRGRRFPTFHLEMRTDVLDVLVEAGRVVGVKAKGPQGERAIRAALTVGCDGRNSTVRAKAGLVVDDLGAPMDVLWFRLARTPEDPAQVLGYVDAGTIFILIARGDYWQAGLVIAKGAFPAIQAKGVEAFRARVSRLAPFLRQRTEALQGWDQVSVLTVRVDRLRQWWRDGLLCIGDAAHAMSPVGGVGINLAVQDAVAAANLLVPAFSRGRVTGDDLVAVQQRRTFPTEATQALQLFVQKNIIADVLERDDALRVPGIFKLVSRWPLLQRIPARVVGVGFRPEHVRTPDVFKTTEVNL